MYMQETKPGSNCFIADQKHPHVVAIAKVCHWFSPAFSPKDVPRFYDLSGICESPGVFRLMIKLFVDRYRAQGDKGPTHVMGYDARGFVLGPPIAMALNLPFVLLRKKGKNPGPLVHSTPYHKEYKEKAPDSM